jgi:hypothetical protein
LTTGNQGIFINTISGGIVNFGGALKIAPVSITTSSTGSGQSNKGTDVTENPAMLLQKLNSIIPAQNKNLTGASKR